MSLQPRLLAGLVASFDALREQARQLVALVLQQGAEIKNLREHVRELRRRLGLSSKNSSKSPSSDEGYRLEHPITAWLSDLARRGAYAAVRGTL
ncbi:MAG: hypothetical protein HYV63_32160 [Candidatus Schekmanbacteria bacterium]|nr:hypothetical protein [Candidatus Schekmanbacteria bacterium]